MKRIYILLIIPLFSCVHSSDNIEDAKKTGTIHISHRNEAVIPDTLFEEVNYAPLETTKESMIGEVNKLVVTDNRFYILDKILAKTLFVFDKTGSFIFKLKVTGKGPGEVLEIMDFCIYENQLLLLDYRKVLFFDLDGNFIREKKIDFAPENISVLNDQNVFLFNNSHVSKNKFTDFHIAKTDISFTGIKKYFKPKRKEINSFYRFQVYNNEMYVTTPQFGDYTLYKYTKNNIMPYINFDFGEYNIPKNKLNSQLDLLKPMNDRDIIDNINILYFLVGSNFSYFLYIQNKHPYCGIYFNKSQKFTCGSSFETHKYASPIMHFVKNDKLYSAVSADRLIRFNKYINKRPNNEYEKLKDKNSSFQIAMHDISGLSNPIIVTYHIKHDLIK